MKPEEIYFVIFPEDGVWVAHGLQHNVVTHGESLQEIRENIEVILEGYQKAGGFSGVPRADATLWEKFIYALKRGHHLDEYLDSPVQEDGTFILELQTV